MKWSVRLIAVRLLFLLSPLLVAQLASAQLRAPVITGLVGGPGRATVSWADSSTGEDGFSLERMGGPAWAWAEVARAPANASSYMDAAIPAGIQGAVCYRLRAFLGAAFGPYSPEQWCLPESMVRGGPPAGTPGPLQAVLRAVIGVGWDDLNAGATAGSEWEQCLGGTGCFTPWMTLGPADRAFVATNVEAGQVWCFRGRYVRGALKSGWASICGTVRASDGLAEEVTP